MGVIITGFRQLKEVKTPEVDEYGYPKNWETEWRPGESMEQSEQLYKGRCKGLDSTKVYKWGGLHSYQVPGAYYRTWVTELAKFAKGKQFESIINFPKDEGVIGSNLAAELLNDFEENHGAAKDYAKSLDKGEVWYEMYLNWLEALELASDGGAIDVHL